MEGGNITLTCNVSGIPLPSVTWKQVGSLAVLSRRASFVVVNVSRPGTPDETIHYECTASNGVGSPATAIASVTVHCKYWSTLCWSVR